MSLEKTKPGPQQVIWKFHVEKLLDITTTNRYTYINTRDLHKKR
jgi:hypothetical protein